MKLTEIERLLLMNQFKILSLLEKTDKYDKEIEALFQGYEIGYNSLSSLGQIISSEDSFFVFKILSMYLGLQPSGKRLGSEAVMGHPFFFFPGFDSKTEHLLLYYAEYLIRSGDHFKKLVVGPDDLDSKTPMVEKYKAMYDLWDSYDYSTSPTEEQFLAILNAG